MRIGIDIDGTIRDIYSPLKKIMKETFHLDSLPISEWTDYEIWNHFWHNTYEITESKFKELWFNSCKTESIYCDEANIYRWTKWGINKLKEDGHKIILISASPNINTQLYTIRWLIGNSLHYDEIHFTEYGSKKFVDCDIYVEDSPYQLRTLYSETGSFIYCVDRPWNKSFTELDNNTEYKRIKDLRELYYNVRRLVENKNNI